jgi:hypothetical protein
LLFSFFFSFFILFFHFSLFRGGGRLAHSGNSVRDKAARGSGARESWSSMLAYTPKDLGGRGGETGTWTAKLGSSARLGFALGGFCLLSASASIDPLASGLVFDSGIGMRGMGLVREETSKLW